MADSLVDDASEDDDESLEVVYRVVSTAELREEGEEALRKAQERSGVARSAMRRAEGGANDS